jgi:hypothetical protein
MRLGVAADRSRRAGGEQGRGRDHEGDGIEHAGVRRHVAKYVLECDVTGGGRGRIGNVDRPRARGRRAREVERHRFSGDGEIERDAQRLIDDAVVVEEILGAPGAIGKRAQIAAHLPRRAGA